jgi:hypothetical protein
MFLISLDGPGGRSRFFRKSRPTTRGTRDLGMALSHKKAARSAILVRSCAMRLP